MAESGKVDTFPTVGDPPPEGEGAAPRGRVLSADSAAVPKVVPITRQVKRVINRQDQKHLFKQCQLEYQNMSLLCEPIPFHRRPDDMFKKQ